MIRKNHLKRVLNWVKKHLFFAIKFKMLHVFEGSEGFYWVVAYDEMDAIRVCIDVLDYDLDNVETFHKIRDFSLFSISEEDSVDKNDLFIPLLGHVEHDDQRDYWKISAPAWAWALANGRGFLCSTEY